VWRIATASAWRGNQQHKDILAASATNENGANAQNIGQERKLQAVEDTTPMLRVVQECLKHCKAENRLSTFNKCGDFLFGLCFGLPCEFWDFRTMGRRSARQRQVLGKYSSA
jgi:hypothetical protein